MHKFRETIIVLLMLLLVASSLYIIYSLLMWQILPRVLSLILLFTLALLKASIVTARQKQASSPLNDCDTRLLKFILLSISCVFLVILYISYVVKNQQILAWTALALGAFSLKRALKFLPAY
jgi:hypothetical protein